MTSNSTTSFILPDLVGHCTYPRHLNQHWFKVSRQSERWLLEEANFSQEKTDIFLGLLAGELTSACYPNAEEYELQVTSDFMGYLFTLDDWSDQFGEEDTVSLAECVMGALRDPMNFVTDKAPGILTKRCVLSVRIDVHSSYPSTLSYFSRYVAKAGPGCTERFIHTMDLFFKAIHQQAIDRQNGLVPDLESYIPVRRDTSGCKPCFALIEFAAGIDLPQEVVSHPLITSLEDATNDLITWSNVRYAPRFHQFHDPARSNAFNSRIYFPTTWSKPVVIPTI